MKHLRGEEVETIGQGKAFMLPARQKLTYIFLDSISKSTEDGKGNHTY